MIVLTDCRTVTGGDLSLSSLEKIDKVTYYQTTSPEELIPRLQEADYLLCNKTVITRAVMDACPRLRYIGLFATGYNNIDLPAAREHGIAVANAGSYSTDAVAQTVFAFLLAHYSMVSEYNSFVQQGGWVRSSTFCPIVFPTDELAGKTIGIFGYGSIGQAVAEIALAFRMRVLVCTRTPRQDERVRFVPFDELLAQSDILTLHCPLTEQTRGLMNDEAFGKCKKGMYFINTSRGPVIDELALKHALESGRLSGAALDVLETEPMPAGCPLLGVKNLTVTPHVAWAPLTTRRRLLGIVEANLRNFIAGAPTNLVT